MLSPDRKYLWQFISAGDGTRSEPFIATVDGVRKASVDITDSERETIYVLCLADIALEIKPQDFVSRFPIYRLSTFLTLDPSSMARPLIVEDNSDE